MSLKWITKNELAKEYKKRGRPSYDINNVKSGKYTHYKVKTDVFGQFIVIDWQKRAKSRRK